MAFFRGFRIFSNLRSVVIERIFQYMKPKEFIRGQHVYTEKLSEVDGLYFIQQGEFEVTQKLDTDKTKTEQKIAKKALSRVKSTNM